MVSNTFKNGYVFHTKYNHGIKMEVTGQGIRKKNEREDVVPSIKAVAQWASKKQQEPLLWQAPNFLHIARRSHKHRRESQGTRSRNKIKRQKISDRSSHKQPKQDCGTNSYCMVRARSSHKQPMQD